MFYSLSHNKTGTMLMECSECVTSASPTVEDLDKEKVAALTPVPARSQLKNKGD